MGAPLFAGLDTTPLTEPFDPSSVTPSEVDPGHGAETRFVLGCGVIAFGLLMGGIGWLFASAHPSVVWVAGGLFALGTAAMVRAAHRSRNDGVERHVRLSRFARANRMRYEGTVNAPSRPGTIFDDGINRRTHDQMIVTEPRVITLGRHHCASGSVGGTANVQPKSWGFATTKLASGEQWPHLYLTATEFDRDTFPTPVALGPLWLDRFDPPGDGGEAYDVRAPHHSRPRVQALLERTLFTPDVLAKLTERPVDVEIVDGYLVLMAQETVTTDPKTWQWILDLTVTVAEALESA